MTVEQVRKILLSAAAMHAKIGEHDLAAVLIEFASILKPYDKGHLEEFVARVTKLRHAAR